jgi:NAD(P)-dependent dehydrogenase (short-subunit alcohol dehydrogenase family)
MTYQIDLSGRVALVTGASGGLGERFAITLAAAGAQVVLAGRRTERLSDLRQRIQDAGGQAHVVAMDVTDVATVRAAVALAESLAGPIDVLVNNSGVSATHRVQAVTEAEYDHIMNTNARGAFFVAQTVGQRMIERAQLAAVDSRTGGRIVNIASVVGLKAFPQISVYSMSKAAVVHMTKAMALEWGRFGINVNAICPGYIDTDMNHDYLQTEAGRKLVAMLPRQRVGEPADLDAVLLLLCSPNSRFINGTVISADDGLGL